VERAAGRCIGSPHRGDERSEHLGIDGLVEEVLDQPPHLGEVAYGHYEVLQGTKQAVGLPCQHDVEAPSARVLEELIECRASIVRTADSVVLVRADDDPAPLGGERTRPVILEAQILVRAGYPLVDRDADGVVVALHLD